MKIIKSFLSELVYGCGYIFLNQFVCYLPCWTLRKMIYQLCGLKIGKKSRIGIGTKVVTPSGISIGERTIINEMCYLDGRGGITIGDDTSISFGTTIITGSHRANNDFCYYTAKVLIGNHVWTGARAIILDGSTLEDGSIIGAGSVLKGTAENCGIYVGNPARFIKKRTDSLQYKIEYHPFFR